MGTPARWKPTTRAPRSMLMSLAWFLARWHARGRSAPPRQGVLSTIGRPSAAGDRIDRMPATDPHGWPALARNQRFWHSRSRRRVAPAPGRTSAASSRSASGPFTHTVSAQWIDRYRSWQPEASFFTPHGASGDELDRYDVELGSPRNAVIVATSLPHSHYYKPVVEDVQMMIDGLDGDRNDKIRSDIVYFQTAVRRRRVRGRIDRVGRSHGVQQLRQRRRAAYKERTTPICRFPQLSCRQASPLAPRRHYARQHDTLCRARRVPARGPDRRRHALGDRPEPSCSPERQEKPPWARTSRAPPDVECYGAHVPSSARASWQEPD
jgi:hypothetical protein